MICVYMKMVIKLNFVGDDMCLREDGKLNFAVVMRRVCLKMEWNVTL